MKKTIALVLTLLLSVSESALVHAKTTKSKKKAKKEATKKKSAPKKNNKDQSNVTKAASSKQSNIKSQKASPKLTKAQEKKLKTEIRAWEQRKKNMEPLQLKDLIEENHRLKTQQRDVDKHIQELELRIKIHQQKNEQLAKLHAEKEKLYIAGAGNTPRELEDLTPGSYTVDIERGQVLIDGIVDNRYGVNKQTGKPFIKGIIFKVQVSADKDIDLSDVLIDDSHHTNLEQEKADNLNKYTIGHFRNYWEADKLKKGLRKMGLRWAWIVPYKDGKRVLLKEVLDTVIRSKKE